MSILPQMEKFISATHRQNWGRSKSVELIWPVCSISWNGNGGILAHDPKTKSTIILFEDLNFANGVAVDLNGRFLLVAETGSHRIIKHWLQGDRKGQREI